MEILLPFPFSAVLFIMAEIVPTILRCSEHKLFKTQREADDELGKIALYGLRKGGRTWRLLKVFPCGDHWHVGRDWKNRHLHGLTRPNRSKQSQ